MEAFFSAMSHGHNERRARPARKQISYGELEQRVMEVLGDGLEVRVDRVHIMYKRGEAKQPYTTWRALPLGIRVP